MTCERFDVVVVPFPFSDLPRAKKRKALVVSHREFNATNESTILLMITSATQSDWLGDVRVSDLASGGLNKECVVRMKAFTLDNGLLLDRCGRLGSRDANAVEAALRNALLTAQSKMT